MMAGQDTVETGPEATGVEAGAAARAAASCLAAASCRRTEPVTSAKLCSNALTRYSRRSWSATSARTCPCSRRVSGLGLGGSWA